MGFVFTDGVASEAGIREALGAPSERILAKARTTLDAQCRAFIAASPFVLVASADAAGELDISPKGDPAGFLRVLDQNHLVIPDRPGNKRFDGLRNIFENPQIGLIFLVPGRHETVRVNGRAWITNDPELLDSMPVRGKAPWFAIGVEVEECFMHCGKAFLRSKLWDPATHVDAKDLPSSGQVLRAICGTDFDADDYDKQRAERYARREGFY